MKWETEDAEPISSFTFPIIVLIFASNHSSSNFFKSPNSQRTHNHLTFCSVRVNAFHHQISFRNSRENPQKSTNTQNKNNTSKPLVQATQSSNLSFNNNDPTFSTSLHVRHQLKTEPTHSFELQFKIWVEISLPSRENRDWELCRVTRGQQNEVFFLGLGFLFSEALFILLSSLSLSVCVQLNSATTPLLSLSKNVYFVSVSLSFCILIYFFLSLGQRQSLCCFVLLLGHSLSLSVFQFLFY